ncbi:hypothetical protein ACFWHR_13370 [Leucobacter sp. NPDC058333]|uniref:hypothetical protein n=1 Tax=Leucobacter sp. NPDC058333 TaxID=3346450 RepID=UPI0036499D70
MRGEGSIETGPPLVETLAFVPIVESALAVRASFRAEKVSGAGPSDTWSCCRESGKFREEFVCAHHCGNLRRKA